MLLFLLLFIGNLAEGCSWLEAIKEKRVKIQLNGEGLHRHLLLDSRLASLNRFSDCRLLYELTVPPGAYIDSDMVNASLPGHFAHSGHRFDVEASRSRSESHKIWLLSKVQTRKSFVIEEKFQLPIHIRYHPAANEPSQAAEVAFTSPTVFLDCPADFSPLKIGACKGKRIPGLPSISPSWILIEPLEKTKVTGKIPVGDRSLLPTVLATTAAALLAGLAMLVTSGPSSNP